MSKPGDKGSNQESSYERFCKMLDDYHSKGLLVFGGEWDENPDLPEDDPDTIAAAMD